jgi:hypothetical protein
VRVAFCIDWSVDAEREWGTGSLIRSSLITLIVVIPWSTNGWTRLLHFAVS